MFKKYQSIQQVLLALVLYFFSAGVAIAQPEIEPWGNMKGIRIDGHLMEFVSNLSVVKKNWSDIKATGKEKQRPGYIRKGNQQIVTTSIDSIFFTETVEDAGKGMANLTVQLTSKSNVSLEGVYLSLLIPGDYSAKANDVPITSAQFGSKQNALTITFAQPTSIIVRKPGTDNRQSVQVYIPIHSGDLKNGQTATINFSLKSSGVVDKQPVTLTLNTAQAGRAFDGLGGNFRLQNQRTDPQVIDYSLENLRVAWGRVEMPWRFWQPAIDSNPTMEAKAGRMRPNV